jgi:hypothetical protein
MPATTTVKADVGGERYWRGYWTTMHLFEALFQMLDRETWAKFGIDVGEKSDPCDLWPAYIECGGVVVRLEAPEHIPDLETEAQMEVYEAAQTQVARALMMIEPDRLKALAGELFAYSLPVLK